MRIKRFSESEQNEISENRISEIVDELTEFNSNLDSKNKSIESLISELTNFKNESDKNNDQIDDNIALLQLIRKNLEESIDNIDSVLVNFNSYLEDGRKYLYTETK